MSAEDSFELLQDGKSRECTLKLHELGPLVVFEAAGRFSQADIWDFVGEKSRVATFTLRPGSASEVAFGISIVGVPLYSPMERAAGALSSGANLRIQATMRDISPHSQRQLARRGIPIDDISAIHFLPFDRRVERHTTGEKKIPNVITIPYEHNPLLNVDRLAQTLYVMKNNDGVQLAPFEKEQLIGITLALNDGHIDRRILEHLGFTAESASKSPEVCFHRLEATEREGKVLSSHERAQLDALRAIRRMDAFSAVLKELQSCQLEDASDAVVQSALELVFEAASAFRPDVLLTGKHQVFWDLSGYVHIALRHIKEMQISRMTARTPFPYKAEDLKMLIEKVLSCVRDEIQDHLRERPGRMFYRAGEGSVYFHEDYYSFHINGDGRLVNFHPLGPRRTDTA